MPDIFWLLMGMLFNNLLLITFLTLILGTLAAGNPLTAGG